MTEHAPDTFPADAPPPGSYTLDPEQTVIRANVKAMFGLFTVHGTFRLRSGQVSITADPAASGVRAHIEAGSFASGRRDQGYRRHLGHPARRQGLPGHLRLAGQAGARGTTPCLGGGRLVTAHGTTVPAEVRS